jgi:3-methyladenine DNA glycosylase AlkC
MAEVKRKGAKSIKEIPAAILSQLNSGQLETVNLVEWLAIDQQRLLANILSAEGRKAYLQPVLDDIKALKKQTVNTISEAIGKGLAAQAASAGDSQFLLKLALHPADMVRCWSAYVVGKNKDVTIAQMLEQIKIFAADKHFGVREIAWLAVRPAIAGKLEQSIQILTVWTGSADENIRRFASEATRPRGVWCSHIEVLKQNPEMGLPLLEPLKTDTAKYVQDSVGNWLNDAAKTQPGFVRDLCKRWQKESNTSETAYIIKKALRSISK